MANAILLLADVSDALAVGPDFYSHISFSYFI